MANKQSKPRKNTTSAQERAMRRNQIIFGVIAIILVLSMALSLVVNI